MIYFVIALILVLTVSFVVLTYQKSHDKKRFFLSLFLLIVLLIFTYATKILLVYKPLLILHIALLIMAWRSYYFYIKNNILTPYWIFSPALSLSLFIIISLFFRENG